MNFDSTADDLFSDWNPATEELQDDYFQTSASKSMEEKEQQSQFPSMDDTIKELFGELKDNVVEDFILKYTEEMDQYVEDVKNYSAKKMARILDAAELERYKSLWPEKPARRRNKLLSFIKVHPSLATTDPDLLWQRIRLYHMKYGKVAKVKNPSIEEKPIAKVISQSQLE